MRWQLGRRSSNVEDRRGGGGFGRMGGGLGRGPMGPGVRIPIGRAGGLGGLGLVAFLVVALLFGVDPSELFNGTGGYVQAPMGEPAQVAEGPEADRVRDFVASVLGDTEDTWHAIFAARNARYQEPVLVLFTGAVNSACGYAQAATGPFYCPGDDRLYLDTSFFQELSERFGAAGDFAQAYVIAHEVGHHVQNLLGITNEVRQFQAQATQFAANQASVALELQADCLAGVWAHHADRDRNLLEQGDLGEALRAASAIGDDRLQRMAGRRVSPDSFTHGSSEQRERWFRVGFDQGSVDACNTFAAADL